MKPPPPQQRQSLRGQVSGSWAAPPPKPPAASQQTGQARGLSDGQSVEQRAFDVAEEQVKLALAQKALCRALVTKSRQAQSIPRGPTRDRMQQEVASIAQEVRHIPQNAALLAEVEAELASELGQTLAEGVSTPGDVGGADEAANFNVTSMVEMDGIDDGYQWALQDAHDCFDNHALFTDPGYQDQSGWSWISFSSHTVPWWIRFQFINQTFSF